MLLSQVGEVSFAAKVKRGEGSFNGTPAVLMAVLKHPAANSVRLAAEVEEVLRGLAPSLPPGVSADQVSYSQADLINASIENVEHVLRDAVIIVAVVLAAFLMSLRTTVISLLAIPLSLIVTVLVHRMMGATINTMTLGGIAIGIGQLVDDSVVHVENILRRLAENRRRTRPLEVMHVILKASREVRSGILYATAIILLVFLPLFGVTPAQLAQALESLSNGRTVSQVIDAGHRFDVVLKLSDADRTPETLARMRMDTPAGHVPLSSVASIVSGTGPNQIMRESGMRRIVLTANTDGSDMAGIVGRMREIIQATPLPAGYSTSLEGSFRQEEESRSIMAGLCTALSAGLALIPLLFTSDAPGTEILHPVAVAIFGGLISSTLLDTLTTPVLFQCFGQEALARLLVAAEGNLAHETF